MGGSTRAEIIARAAARLAGAGVAEPERDARLLYRWAAMMSGAELSAALAGAPRPREIARFEAAVAQRMERVPVAQITGERAFWKHVFRVTRDTLDPRPETEVLVAEAMRLPPPRRILDLGTGTGCILLSLLAEWPGAEGVGTDASEAALAVAADNAARLGLSARARFLRADWFDGVEGDFDLIVSNPPYLAEDEIAALSPEVRLHEPRAALTCGGDGLDAYRAVAAGTAAHLRPGGDVIIETGPSQAQDVGELFRCGGIAHVATVRDLDGRERVVHGKRPEK